MASLAPPFDAEDHFELQRMVKAGLSKRIPSCFSDDLQRAIVWMLKASPEQRPNASELYGHLLEMSSKSTLPPPPPTPPAAQAAAPQEHAPSTPAHVAASAQAVLQQPASVVFVPAWGFELQLVTRGDGSRFFKVSNVFSGSKSFSCGLTANMELLSVNSTQLSPARLQLHDVTHILSLAKSNGGAGITLELRALDGPDGSDQRKIVFLTDDSASDSQLLTARTLSMPPPPSSPAQLAPAHGRAQTLGAVPVASAAPPSPAVSSDVAALSSRATLSGRTALLVNFPVDSVESKSTVRSPNASVQGAGAGSVEISKLSDVIPLMAARIEQLERNLEALRRENAALREASQSSAKECAVLRQQLQQHQRVVVHDIKSPDTTPPPPPPPLNAALFSDFVPPPPPHHAPPSPPVSQQQNHVQAQHHASSTGALPPAALPAFFQQQLEHHSHQSHVQIQQFPQKQQQPIARPGPALASTFDALSYNFRDGLTLPALEMPQLLAAHAPLADNSKTGTGPELIRHLPENSSQARSSQAT
jgi:hypothetical protein